MTAELRELRANLEEVKRARFPAARPRDPAQNQIGGAGNGAPQLHASLSDTDDPEDHLQGHADEACNQQYVPRGEELPRGRREDRRDAGDYYERRHVRGDVKELDLQFAPRGNGVPRGHHEIHRDLEGAHERRFRRDGDHYRDRRDHGDNFDLAYLPRGHWLPHHRVHPHDDDAYHERPVRRDDAGCYDRRDSFHLKLPKYSFPVFKGQFPLLWIDNCYNYFEMYNVPDRHWASTATLYFEDHAALWLQAYKRTHRQMNWDALITALVAEFGSDDYDGQMSSLL